MTATPSHRIAVGACGNCGYGIALTTGTRTTCPNCTEKVALRWVAGTHNKQIPCDWTCQYARSNRCSCSCGGANHGAGYIQVDMVPSFIRQRDAEAHAAKIRRAQQRRQSAKNTAAAAATAQVAAHPELTVLLNSPEYAEGFMGDLRRELRYGRPLSTRQLDAAIRIVREDQSIHTTPEVAA